MMTRMTKKGKGGKVLKGLARIVNDLLERGGGRYSISDYLAAMKPAR